MDNQNILHCSPYSQKMYAKSGTCYSTKELHFIVKEYNKLTKSEEDKISITNKTKKNLHRELSNKFKHLCKKELCWANQIKNEKFKNKIEDSFRPLKPKEWYTNKQTWLNTYDILYVMEQYHKLYKNFKFMGVYPIDFASYYNNGDCIGDNLCNFNIKNLPSKITQFGIILNLDYHNQPGSHWVAIYCNLNQKNNNFGIYYYDSVANEPPKEAIEFMNLVKSQVNLKKNINFELKYNKIQKQFDNYDCGMFSIIFLTQCLKYIPFDFICKNMKTDKEINDLRNVIYHPSQKSNVGI